MPRLVEDDERSARRRVRVRASARQAAEPAVAPEDVTVEGAEPVGSAHVGAASAVPAQADATSRACVREDELERLPALLRDPDVLEARREAAEAVQAELAAVRERKRKRRRKAPQRSPEQRALLRRVASRRKKMLRAQALLEAQREDRIALFREGRELGLTFPELAAAAGTTPEYVLKVVSGTRR